MTAFLFAPGRTSAGTTLTSQASCAGARHTRAPDLAHFEFLSFVSGLEDLDQGADLSAGERSTFVYKRFVASKPRVSFRQFCLRRACPDELDDQVIVCFPEHSNDVIFCERWHGRLLLARTAEC